MRLAHFGAYFAGGKALLGFGAGRGAIGAHGEVMSVIRCCTSRKRQKSAGGKTAPQIGCGR
jgi:hypothetical protein